MITLCRSGTVPLSTQGGGVEGADIGICSESSRPRRTVSMSLLESGPLENSDVSERTDCDEEPMVVKSYGRQYKDVKGKNAKLKSLFPHLKKQTNEYGTFSSGSRESKLLLSQQQKQQQQDETRSRGEVGLGVYWKYISAGSPWFGVLLLLMLSILVQLLFSGSDYWLQYWTKIEESNSSELELLQPENFSMKYETVTEERETNSLNDYLIDRRDIQVYVYCALVGSLFVLSMIKNAAFFHICLNSSIELHRRLFHGVMRAPMRFFEINPSGRVLNRFAKDIGVIDEMLPATLSDTFWTVLQVIGVVVIVSVNNPYLLLPSLSLPVVFYFVRRFYLKTAKSLKHLESIARSPVFSHLSTSLYGLTTIRAMGVENQFEKQFDAYQDLHSASWILFIATAKWLGIFVDWCCVMYIGVVILTFLFMKGENSGPEIGLSIASAMSLSGVFQWGVRQSAEAENQMVSVERVQEYAELESEGELESRAGYKPPCTWPSKGEIVFRDFTMKYGNDSPVLKNITCIFKSGEKVGIVGRTGAGKSSLITALFRITHPERGDIIIDGLSIFRLGLHDLRNKISIIPQDPVLFNNTLRNNLDPFSNYNDQELWSVLEQVYLADTVRESPAGLDTVIAEGGSNFSVGQRQLICMGRAILRKNKILVLDEATANVDHETDALIQKTIREQFAKCTVLTIAHRLDTVMDSDRMLLLDAGEIKEFDEPYKLLCNERSALSRLVRATGKATAAKLYKAAKTAHEKRNMDRGLEMTNQ